MSFLVFVLHFMDGGRVLIGKR